MSYMMELTACVFEDQLGFPPSEMGVARRVESSVTLGCLHRRHGD